MGLSLGDGSLTLESGVDIDERLVSRSPLVRAVAPVFRFFRSRAGEPLDELRRKWRQLEPLGTPTLCLFSPILVGGTLGCNRLHCVEGMPAPALSLPLALSLLRLVLLQGCTA